jgi:DNA-binding CsgD family transcriptional regulator
MSRPVPAHGTTARRWGAPLRPPCTCPTCLHGERRARKLYLVQLSRGQSGLAQPQPVTAHLRKALASGRTITQIAAEAKVSPQTVRDAVRGRRDGLWKENADKLMAVSLDPDPHALVNSTGTVRRLRALVAMGQPQDVLAKRAGCSYTYISTLTHGQRATVTVALAQAVQQAYDELWMAVGPSEQARKRAKRLGWDGPLAWDEDTIDDPRAVPQTDAVGPVATEGGNVAARWLLGEAVILGRDDRREVLQHLFEWTNHTTEEIAARLDMSPEAAEQQWNRMKRKARDEGRRMWRRVYVPRERDLNQNEMREAA